MDTMVVPAEVDPRYAWIERQIKGHFRTINLENMTFTPAEEVGKKLRKPTPQKLSHGRVPPVLIWPVWLCAARTHSLNRLTILC